MAHAGNCRQVLAVLRWFWLFFACALEIPESGERSVFCTVFPQFFIFVAAVFRLQFPLQALQFSRATKCVPLNTLL